MPYIEESKREDAEWLPITAGELNFAITQMVLGFLQRGGHKHNPSYASFNEVIGVLECVKLELYRRKIAPYEDIKCDENGDVY